MTSPTASVTPLSPSRATDTPGVTQSRTANSGDPFQTVLATATNQAQQTTAPQEAVALADATALETETDDLTSTADDAGLAGLLLLAQQVLAPPVNAAVAQAVGLAPTAAAPVAVEDGTRTRADQLLLDQPGTPLPANAQAIPATDDQPAPVAPPAPDLTPEIPNAAQATTTAQTATATALRGGTSSIPAQAPIVTNLLPNVPVPTDPSVTNPPVSEPTATEPTAAVPDTQLGDRPATAGDRFAAIAFASAQLASTEAPPAGAFASALNQELPVSALTTESRPADEPTATGAVPAAAPAPFLDRGTVVTAPATVQATPAAQIADAVVTHAQVIERPGSVEFQMRLDPPELGRLQIRLVARGDEVHGQVLVADDAVRRMIESQLPELRQRLEAAGVNVQSLDIATDPNTGGSRNLYQTESVPEFAPRPAPASAPRARINRSDAGSLDVTV